MNWYIRNFKIITTKKAIELGLTFSHNVYGDAINYLNCRSIWIDKYNNSYRVKELK